MSTPADGFVDEVSGPGGIKVNAHGRWLQPLAPANTGTGRSVAGTHLQTSESVFTQTSELIVLEVDSGALSQKIHILIHIVIACHASTQKVQSVYKLS